MKNLYFALLVLFICACDKELPMQDIPECAKTKINLAMRQPARVPAYNISKWMDASGRYLYRVDVVPTEARDFPIEYYDEQCNMVYSVGGVTGVFPAGSLPLIENLTFVETLWEDPR